MLLTVTNMGLHEKRAVETSLRGIRFSRLLGRLLAADVMDAHNTFAEPGNVAPASFDGACLASRRLVIDLPRRPS